MISLDTFTLRPITLADTESFFNAVSANRDRISTYFPGIVTKTNTLEETRTHIEERIAGADEGKYMIWLIVENRTDKIAGVIQNKDIDFNARKRELGYWVDSNYLGQGLATRAISAICKYNFEELQLNKMFMRIAEENAASRRVAEKCGFVLEGVMRNDFMTSGQKLIDIFYYGLIKSDLI